MTSQPNQDVNDSGDETNKAVSDAEEKSIRDLVTPDTAVSISDNDIGDDRDDSPGLDRDETFTGVVSSLESEVNRALIVPDVASASKSDHDRSPGLDRNLTGAE